MYLGCISNVYLECIWGFIQGVSWQDDSYMHLCQNQVFYTLPKCSQCHATGKVFEDNILPDNTNASKVVYKLDGVGPVDNRPSTD